MTAAPYRSAGRRFFPDVIYALICEKVAGGLDLKTICSDPSMPCVATVYNAISSDPILSQKYTAAVRTAVERRAKTAA